MSPRPKMVLFNRNVTAQHKSHRHSEAHRVVIFKRAMTSNALFSSLTFSLPTEHEASQIAEACASLCSCISRLCPLELR